MKHALTAAHKGACWNSITLSIPAQTHTLLFPSRSFIEAVTKIKKKNYYCRGVGYDLNLCSKFTCQRFMPKFMLIVFQGGVFGAK